MKCVRILRLESRKASINNQNLDLSVNRQLKLLQVPHSSFYYKSQREISRTASDERVKDEMMEIYMETRAQTAKIVEFANGLSTSAF